MSRQGPNALDFHIAYYLGKLSKNDSKVYCHIISKDKGFDALIDYTNAKEKDRIWVDRVESIDEIPLVKKKNSNDILALVKKRLGSKPRPARLKKLQNAIKTWLNLQDIAVINGIVEVLKKEKFLTIDENGKLSYSKES